MYVDARAESGAGAATTELPWTHWRLARKDAGPATAAATGSGSRVTEHHKRPSAAAMALARKRQRKRQQELGDSASEASNEPDEEEEEEEITAFVEYNANDMDSLDINPSQDFDGEISVRGDADNYRRRTQPWAGNEDDTEEASEVFDNVIYAPLPSLPKPAVSAPVVNKTAFAPQPTAQAETKPVTQQSPVPEEEDDDSLSDGFEVDPEFANSLNQGRRTSPRRDASDKSANELVWRQRRSVKRDCTFVDTDSITGSPCVSSASGRADSTPRSSIKVIELVDDDNSIESIEACSLAEQSRAGSSRAAPTSTSSGTSSTSLVVANRTAGFQPRLQMKRRKVEHQLTLDGFFRCRPFN